MRHAVARALVGLTIVVLASIWLAAGDATRAQTAAAAGSVIGACHVSPIVQDLDRAAAFYHGLLGLDLVPTPAPGPLPLDTDPGHLHLLGLPTAKLRFIGARMPGVRCGIEIVELAGVDRSPVQRRIQDPGAVTLILLVRDVDALFAKMKRTGVPIVTTGGAPMAVGKARVVIVKDPDDHFVELAQLDPPPATTLPASSQVIGIRLRVTVGNVDRATHVYRDLLGLEPKTGAFTSNDAVMSMMGLPAGRGLEYRLTTTEMPSSPLLLEFLELKGLEGKATTARIQDPGSYRLLLNVNDVDAALAAVKTTGAKVLSSGGQPVRMTFGGNPWRLAATTDPNNLFLILMQPPPRPSR